MPLPILAQLAIAVVGMAVSYLLTPRLSGPKATSRPQEMGDPTAEAGKPVPVVFGEMLIDSPNILWFGEKATRSRKVKP